MISNTLEMYNKDLAIGEKVFGKEHPYTATSYTNIGAVMLAMCDILGALDMLKRALAINDKVLGKEHPDTIDSLDAVAAILRIYDMK
jgi:hypothetical protein|tara:strand:- start:694 stop:954 length:261 start_codon:yes stop_codon:yes gene_type:complete